MAIEYRFENQNPFPVVVPGHRGVGVTFARGQWSTDAWFSRFVGPRQLSRVAVTTDGTPIRAPAVPRALSAASERSHPPVLPMKHKLLVQVSETTAHWEKRDGIYYCKHCDLFRTGGRIPIINHLTGYHQLELSQLDLQPVDPQVDEELASADEDSVSADEAFTPVEESPALEEEALQRTPVVAGELCTTGVKIFPCPHCEREYMNASGLAVHVAEAHPSGA